METPSSRAARMTRTAISPRLAIRILRSTAANVGAVVERAAIPPRPWPPGWTVEHVAETGSTNADLLAAAGVAPGPQRPGRRPSDRRARPPRSPLGRATGDEPPREPAVPRGRRGSGRAHPAGRARRRRRLPRGRRRRPRCSSGPTTCSSVTASSPGSSPSAAPEQWSSDLVSTSVGRRRERPGSGRTSIRSTCSRPCSPRSTRLPADVTARYRQTLATLGRRVRIELVDGVIDGTATDVDPDGRLVVRRHLRVTHRIAVGDVVHLRWR